MTTNNKPLVLDHRTCTPSESKMVWLTGGEQDRKVLRVRYRSPIGDIHDIYYNHLCQVRQVDAMSVYDMSRDWVNGWQVILNKILQLNFNATDHEQHDHRI